MYKNITENIGFFGKNRGEKLKKDKGRGCPTVVRPFVRPAYGKIAG
jgi:hypothetical protein